MTKKPCTATTQDLEHTSSPTSSPGQTTSTNPEVLNGPLLGLEVNGGVNNDGNGVGAGDGASGGNRGGSDSDSGWACASPEQTGGDAKTLRGRNKAPSSTWTLGTARRRSVSPEVGSQMVSPGGTSGNGRDSRGGGGGGGVTTATTPLKGALKGVATSVGVGTTSPAPRSILVTSKETVSTRRVAAVALGVRWLDIVQEEEQQASNRRRRASRWTGGVKKRQGPPTAAPRVSRAKAFA